MRICQIKINNDATVTVTDAHDFIGEHRATQLSIMLNSDLTNSSISYYTLCFKPGAALRNPPHCKLTSDMIPTTSVSKNALTYRLPAALTCFGSLDCQVIAHCINDKNEVTEIIKSPVFRIFFEPSISGEDELFVEQAQGFTTLIHTALSQLNLTIDEADEMFSRINEAYESGELNGAVIMPHVSADGTLSWSNDAGFENPAPINLKGPKGDKGEKGDDGEDGKDGKDATINGYSTVNVRADGDMTLVQNGNTLTFNVDSIKLYHNLPQTAKDGDICLHSPANTLCKEDSGKLIYVDWDVFNNTFSKDDFTQFSLTFFDTDGSQVGYIYATTTDKINNSYITTFEYTKDNEQWSMNFVGGVLDTENSFYTDGTTISNIAKSPDCFKLPCFSHFESEQYNISGDVFYAPIRLMIYRGGWYEYTCAAAAHSSSEKKSVLPESTKTGSFIHISFDDVTLCIENLINKTYTSVFEEPFFAWLKSLNEQYGAKFSLYVMNIANLANVPDTYKSEFLAAKDWLKFGLHSNTANSTYENATYATGAADWNAFVSQIIRITGTFETIDRVPRLHYFYGSKEALQGMRDCECGALGFLAADDSRQSYYLTASQNSFLKTHDSIIDFANGLLFYNTDFRGDWFKSGFTSENIYNVPVKSNVYDELLYRFALAKYADTFKSYIYFCHEWQFYNGTVVNENRAWTEDICRFGNDYNIPFDYPQNRIDINPTSFTFLSVNSGGITDSGEYLFSTFETFVLDSNNTRLRANLIHENFTFKANDVISIGDYNTYALAVGSGMKEDDGDYDDVWFNGGYVTTDFVLTAEQAASVKQIIIKRNDGAALTETDLNYLYANVKIIRQ